MIELKRQGHRFSSHPFRRFFSDSPVSDAGLFFLLPQAFGEDSLEVSFDRRRIGIQSMRGADRFPLQSFQLGWRV
jgi:hypothetical protein